MAYYYKLPDNGTKELPPLDKINVYQNDLQVKGPCTDFDFTKHVLVELLDDVTPEAELWEEMDVLRNKNVIHKRMIADNHRLNCRRAIVVCNSAKEATELAQHVSQAKIKERCVCAVVVHELLSDLRLFEKQIRQHGDNRPQQQLVYITDLNRCRGSSALVQYLKEKFSPFGSILSVLVSEDKDGYAFPEGVIRFAYLSEAFAAELAYDQYIIGMERLSVTTHHNILLCQCDLRARLREAQLKVNYMDAHFISSDSDSSEIVPNHNSSLKRTSSLLHVDEPIRSSNVNSQRNPELSDSMQLADVAESSSQAKLFKCLKGTGCNGTVSNRLGDAFSTSNEHARHDSNQTTNSRLISSTDMSTFSHDQPWSSRVIKWISELPEADFYLGGDVGTGMTQADLSKERSELDLQQTIPLSPLKTGSTSGTFFTCDDGACSPINSVMTVMSIHSDIDETMDLTLTRAICNDVAEESQRNISRSPSPISYDKNTESSQASKANNGRNISLLSQGIHSNSIITNVNNLADIDTIADMNITVPLGIQNNVAKNSVEHVMNVSGSSSFISNAKNTESSQASTASKRRNTSLLSQKLSLKNRRINSSQKTSDMSVSEITAQMSLFTPKECQVVLNTIPELDIISKNYSSFDSPVIKLNESWLSQALLENAALSVSPTMCETRRNPAEPAHVSTFSSLSYSSPLNSSNKVSCSVSEKSSAVRRSSRLASRQSKVKLSNELSFTDMERESKPFNVRNSINEYKSESPLRVWLKKELIFSTNNRVSNSKESSKSIICATMNKDILISVGCSYMTCNVCYPDSTNLLLGFHSIRD